MLSPCWMESTTSLPLVTLPKTVWRPVEMRLRRVRDEELAAIGVRACVRHRNNAGVVLERIATQFVLELVAGTAAPGACGVAALNHEVVDDAMKRYSVIEAFASQKDEVVDRLGRMLGIELEFDRASVGLHCGAIDGVCVDGDVGRRFPAFHVVKDNRVSAKCGSTGFRPWKIRLSLTSQLGGPILSPVRRECYAPRTVNQTER
jgi:hypothetical protein